ncbi:hypothetical protein [Kitasatospora sp. NPDC015120]|uniref:hypothetical protein n=1 Tax=Kitasatospora sp. NPDC015120 TaxID=3364023 RepID=UPI0036F485A3
MDSIYTGPATAADTAVDLNAYLLQDGFVPASLDGQVVAVPLQLSPATPALIPALVDGKVIAVPVHNPLATAAAATARQQPDPAPARPAADPGLPLALRQGLRYGAGGLLAAGAVTWMVGAGIGEVAPHADQIGKILMWATITIATVAIGVAALLGKLRAITSGSASGTPTTADDGSTAAGTVLAMFHRHTEVTIGKQSAGWKGTVNNDVR